MEQDINAGVIPGFKSMFHHVAVVRSRGKLDHLSKHVFFISENEVNYHFIG